MVHYIQHPLLEVDVITCKKESPWERCNSCNHTFQINDDKVKWRSHITGNGHNFAVWHIQCKPCALETFNGLTVEFSSQNLLSILNPQA